MNITNTTSEYQGEKLDTSKHLIEDGALVCIVVTLVVYSILGVVSFLLSRTKVKKANHEISYAIVRVKKKYRGKNKKDTNRQSAQKHNTAENESWKPRNDERYEKLKVIKSCPAFLPADNIWLVPVQVPDPLSGHVSECNMKTSVTFYMESQSLLQRNCDNDIEEVIQTHNIGLGKEQEIQDEDE